MGLLGNQTSCFNPALHGTYILESKWNKQEMQNFLISGNTATGNLLIFGKFCPVQKRIGNWTFAGNFSASLQFWPKWLASLNKVEVRFLNTQISELSICTTGDSRTVGMPISFMCPCIKIVICRTSQFHNTQRIWQPLWCSLCYCCRSHPSCKSEAPYSLNQNQLRATHCRPVPILNPCNIGFIQLKKKRTKQHWVPKSGEVVVPLLKSALRFVLLNLYPTDSGLAGEFSFGSIIKLSWDFQGEY